MNRWGKAGSKLGILLLLSVSCVVVAEERVGITKDLQSIRVQHGKEWVEVLRNQDETHQIDENFAKTSRPCPPFCIQPMAVAPGVESVGELELLQFMEQKLPAGAGVLVDARTPDWHSKGTIPGSVMFPIPTWMLSWEQINSLLSFHCSNLEYYLEGSTGILYRQKSC